MRSFKKIAVPVFVIVIIMVINQVLLMALEPHNFFRNDMHNIKTKEYDDVFIGTSHGKAGIQPDAVDAVTGRKSVNMCLGGQYPIDSYFLVKAMLRYNKPKRIIYELDPGYWVTEASLGPDYATVYEEIPWSMVKIEYFKEKMLDIDFRATLFPWYVYRQGYKNMLPTLQSRIAKAYRNFEDSFYNSDVQSYGANGAVKIHRIEGAEKSKENLVFWDEEKIIPESAEYFERLVELCKKEGVDLVVVTTPVPVETRVEGKGSYERADEYFKEYMKKRNIPYYNFDKIQIEGFDNTVNGFSDYEGHMYEDQGMVFSKRVGEILNTGTLKTK